MDDVGIGGATIQQHQRLYQVLEHVTNADLKLNREKVKMREKSTEFLGHKISAEGIQTDESKVSTIWDTTDPTDVLELWRLLRMVKVSPKTFHRHLQPLNTCLPKDAEWTWGPAQVETKTKAKEQLMNVPCLAYNETIVCSNASSCGIGCVSFQRHDGQLKPVAFCSHQLSSVLHKLKKSVWLLVKNCSW